VVITGSSANVPNREPWMLETEAYLREVVRLSVPVFGICFGHQMLAQALGGEVQKNPRGREIGTIRVARLADDPLFDSLPEAFEANATHVDTVVKLPPGAVPLAKSDLEDHHAIRFSETCYGVQFHPELDADVMRGYVEHRWEILASEGFAVESLHAQIAEAEFGRRTIRNFIHHILPRGAQR
jgi:GMP synthase (glutamine-hydrolysing)